MDLWIVLLLYLGGLALVVAETLLPGMVLGLMGAAAVVTSVVFGFRHHPALGAGQIVLAAVMAPAAFYLGLRRLQLKSSLDGSLAFGQDYAALVGKEGVAQTDLRPAGIVLVDGRKVDVVTAGEAVERGRPVRVVKVEGNRIVVRAIQGG
jgi:membrane-bound serine protease (ClpP class)